MDRMRVVVLRIPACQPLESRFFLARPLRLRRASQIGRRSSGQRAVGRSAGQERRELRTELWRRGAAEQVERAAVSRRRGGNEEGENNAILYIPLRVVAPNPRTRPNQISAADYGLTGAGGIGRGSERQMAVLLLPPQL